MILEDPAEDGHLGGEQAPEERILRQRHAAKGATAATPHAEQERSLDRGQPQGGEQHFKRVGNEKLVGNVFTLRYGGNCKGTT